MNDAASPTQTKAPRRTKSAARQPRQAHGLRAGTSDANRLAMVILEVLAGVRTPPQAAEAIQISLPRYYQLETRALEGLVAACERKPVGKQPSPQTRIRALEKQIQRLERDCARQQSLARAAQRGLGLAPPPPAKPREPERGRRRRQPVVRALRAVRTLAKSVANSAAAGVEQSSEPTAGSAQETLLIETGPPGREKTSPAFSAGRTPTTPVDSQHLPARTSSLNKSDTGTDSRTEAST